MRQDKTYLDGNCLGVEVSHQLIQGSEVLLDLLCEVPAGRLILLHSTLTCLSLVRAYQLSNGVLDSMEHIRQAPAL